MPARLNCNRHGGCAVLIVALSLLLVAESASAQQQGIIGVVRDETGGTLPGVTVTATSPSLQVPQVVDVSDAQGEYRLTPLPLGTYTVTYELQGFQTLRREGIRLTVDFVAKVDVQLAVGALADQITVVGQSPVVDVTSTKASTQFTNEQLQVIPTNRNALASLLVQVPGVRSTFEQSGANVASPVRAFGQGGGGWLTMDGVLSQSAQYSGTAGVYLDYNVIDEARVLTFAGDAESASRGVQVNGIVKSGSNQFHGSGQGAFTSSAFQSSNINDELAAQGITSGNKLNERTDYSAEVGGRIIRDKLWFYVSPRRVYSEQQQFNAFNDDGTPAIAWDSSYHFTDKISYQLNPSNRFIQFFQYHKKYELDPLEARSTNATRVNSQVITYPMKVEWQATRGNSLVLSLQQGYFRFRTDLLSNYTTLPAMYDVRTQLLDGAHLRHGTVAKDSKFHTTGSLTWYRPRMFLGSHEFKGGMDLLLTNVSRGFNDRGEVGNYQLQFDATVPFQFVAFNYPSLPVEKATNLAVYARDSWRATDRLTFNLGVRFTRDNGYVPAACSQQTDFAAPECFGEVQFKIWNVFSPRLHMAYDVSGNGRTVIKGGWGRYDHMRSVYEEVLPADPSSNSFTTYRWHDLNGDRRYQPGEVNLDLNGPDFVSRVATYQASPRGGFTTPNFNEARPVNDELSLTIEQELIENFAVRASGVYTRYANVIRQQNNLRLASAYTVPVTRPDPGPDGRAGTADDPGVNFTYYEYPTSLQGARFEQFINVNDPDATQNYKSFEFSAFKRLSNNWQMSASYSATKRHIPNVGSTGDTAVNIIALPLNPNSDINTLDDNWEWLARVMGAYTFPWDITASANFQSLSGNPFARTVLFTGGQTIPSQVLNVEPVGTRRLPVRNLLDLRFEKSFQIKASQKLGLRLNIYNALNANTVSSLTNRSGASFLRPTAIMAPRYMELGAVYFF